MVRFDLNLQTISSNSIVTICPSRSLLEIVIGQSDVLSVVSEKIPHSRPALFWSKISKGFLGREYGGYDMFHCLLLWLSSAFGAHQAGRHQLSRLLLPPMSSHLKP